MNCLRLIKYCLIVCIFCVSKLLKKKDYQSIIRIEQSIISNPKYQRPQSTNAKIIPRTEHQPSPQQSIILNKKKQTNLFTQPAPAHNIPQL